MSDRKLFSRMVLLGEKLKINLKDLLTYSLGTISYPLSASDGSLAKTQKSKLVALVESTWRQPPLERVQTADATVIDGMVLIHGLKIKDIPSTMGLLAARVFKKVVSIATESKASRVDIVFDSYPDVSIKEPEHQIRSTGDFTFGQLRLEMKVPKQFKKFLCSNKSKINLIHFLVDQWFNERFDFTLYVAYDNECRHSEGGQVTTCPRPLTTTRRIRNLYYMPGMRLNTVPSKSSLQILMYFLYCWRILNFFQFLSFVFKRLVRTIV